MSLFCSGGLGGLLFRQKWQGADLPGLLSISRADGQPGAPRCSAWEMRGPAGRQLERAGCAGVQGEARERSAEEKGLLRAQWSPRGGPSEDGAVLRDRSGCTRPAAALQLPLQNKAEQTCPLDPKSS